MARPISTGNVALIVSHLSEANATEVKGLSITEISEATGIPRSTVDRIIKRPEFGFRESAAKSSAGATTYYHDFTEMMIYSEEEQRIQPLVFDSEEKTRFVLTNLMNAIMAIDPTNKLVAAVGKEIAEKGRGGKSQQKDFFDWLMYPFKSDLIAYLTENHKAKDMTDPFLKDIEEWPLNANIHAKIHDHVMHWWNPETKDFRPEAIKNKDSYWKLLVSLAGNALMLAAYIREQEGETDKESSITSG